MLLFAVTNENETGVLTSLALAWGARLGFSLLIFAAFWLAGFILRGIMSRLGEARKIDANLTRFLARAATSALLIVGGITALGTLGINVAALVAGLGMTGFAFGFALKDIISNTLSGIMIIIYKPFECHDTIKVSSFEGEVVEIDLRYTQLKSDVNRS